MSNQYSADVPKGFNVPKQVRLDSITGIQNEETLKNLGTGNNLAFKYYDGLKVRCKDEKTEYIWREVVGVEEGLLDTNFIYPTYPAVDGIDYSGKAYNFFLITNGGSPANGSETKINSGTNTTVTGLGTIASPYVINSTDTVANGSETKINEGTNITVMGIGTILDPYIINADLTDLGIVKTIDNEVIAPGQTLSIINNELTGKVLITKEYVESVIPSSPDGSETKINPGDNVIITGTGTTLDPYIINSDPEDSITYINGGDDIEVIGSGTIDNPYVINSINTQPDTKEEFNERLTDGDFLFVGDVTQYTDELARDAVGQILLDTDTIDFIYNDGLNTISAEVKPNSIDATHLVNNINISEFINDSNYATIDEVNVLKWIKSNESLTLSQRKGDVLYGILDQYTGEEMTLSKVTGTPTVDGVIYFQLGAEYFKRNIANKVQAAWFGFRADGLSASSTANAAALQAAIDYCATLPTTHSIEFQGYEIQLPLGDSYCEQVNVKGQCMIVGEGKTTTRLYYVGTDYFLKGDVAFISHGGLRDLQINPAPGTTCLGLVYLKNAYNINYTNVTLNGTTSSGFVTEAVVKMVSQQSWTVGANNNLYKIVFDNLNIYGSLGHGILITGDYGSAEMVVKNSIIENLDGHGIYVASSTNVANSNLKISKVIFQGGGLGALKLEAILNADIEIYSETSNAQPIITLGSATTTFNNVNIHNSSFGNGGTGYGGAIIKSAPFGGLSMASSGVNIENCNFLSVDSNDYVTEIYAQNVSLKNISLTGITKLFKGNNYVDGGNNGLGSYTIDLTNRSYGASNLTEVNTGAIIPNGKISYWLGDRMVGTNTKQQKFLTSDDAIGKNDINSDVFLTGVSNLGLGSIHQYYTRKHFMFSIHNLSASPVTISIGDGGLINGSAIYTLAGYSSVDLHHSDTTTGVYAISITPSDSPTLTGTPTAPTATVGTNTTQIATTAFVLANARPYKVYTALLSQSGTSAPTATVLENTLGGTVVWTRNTTGQYFGTLSTAFVSDKTFCLTGGNTNNENIHSTTQRNNDNEIVVQSYSSGAKTDGVLNKTAIEIRVYN